MAFYGPLGNFDLTGEYVNSDWGVYNTISNGGSRQWRTPTADEINYLLMERVTPSGIRFAKAEVAGVWGLIVLPDDWNEATYHLRGVNVNCDFSTNKITASEWLDMLEPAGAVFLPAAGWRFQPSGETWTWYENMVSYSSYCEGVYWTSTACDGVDYGVDWALAFYFTGTDGLTYAPGFVFPSYRCDGNSVRLISDEGTNYR